MQCDRFLSFSPNDKDPLISGYGPLLSVIDIYLERQLGTKRIAIASH